MSLIDPASTQGATAANELVKSSAAELGLNFNPANLRPDLHSVHFDLVQLGAGFHYLLGTGVQPDGRSAALVLNEIIAAGKRVANWEGLNRSLIPTRTPRLRFWPPDGQHENATGAVGDAARLCGRDADAFVTGLEAGGLLLTEAPGPIAERVAMHWPRIRKRILKDFPVADIAAVVRLALEEVRQANDLLRPCPLVLNGRGQQAEYKGDWLSILPDTTYDAVEELQKAYPKRLDYGCLGGYSHNIRKLVANVKHSDWHHVISRPKLRPRVRGYAINP